MKDQKDTIIETLAARVRELETVNNILKRAIDREREASGREIQALKDSVFKALGAQPFTLEPARLVPVMTDANSNACCGDVGAGGSGGSGVSCDAPINNGCGH